MLGGSPSLFSSIQARIAQLVGDSSGGCARWVLVLALLAPALSLLLPRTRPVLQRMAPSLATTDPKQPSGGPVPGLEDPQQNQQQQQQHCTHGEFKPALLPQGLGCFQRPPQDTPV